MSALRRALQRILALFHQASLSSDNDREMAAHLALATDENIVKGMSPKEARRQAMIRFGGVQQAREKHRESRGIPALEVLAQDLRYTLRTLGRDAGFTTVAILILALGIGANIIVFSVVNTLLLRPLPFQSPKQLVWMEGSGGKGLSSATYSVDAYREFLKLNHSFTDVAAYNPFYGANDFKLTGHGEPQPLSGVGVTANFLSVLGLQPVLGRSFAASDAIHSAAQVVIFSNAYWRRQFNADPNIIGRSITLNDTPTTVIGILPATFDFASIFDPAAHIDMLYPTILEDMRDDGNELFMIGRLKPGIPLSAAQADVDLVSPYLPFSLKHPDWGMGKPTAASILQDHVSGKLRRSLIVLWCAVGMILLIVCVNLANLLIARAAARQKEFALRSALGAGRGRLIRQMATESLVLATAGGLLGLALAFAGTTWLAHQGSISLPLLSSIRVDATTLLWTIAMVLVSAILFGVLPALRVASGNLQDALKDGGHGAGDGRRHERVRSVLVISEVALACVLLVCAGLLLRSFLRVLDVDLGFNPSRAAALKVDYSLGNIQGLTSTLIYERRAAVLQEMLRRITALPGIESAGVVDMLPLDRNRSWGFHPVGRPYVKGEDHPTFIYVATPGYLDAMGIRVREGRDFTWADRADTQRVIVISRAAARQMWPGENAIGKSVEVGGTPRTIIGIVDDVRETSLEESPSIESYLPATQASPEGAELMIRTKLPPAVLAASVMHTLREMNPNQPATEFRTMQSLVNRSASPRRFFAMLVAAFATLGILLAALGIYGVISYSVTRQTQEIGIRMALGATLRRVRWDVMAGTLRLAVLGVVLGSIAAAAAAHGITSLLFDTTPADPAIYLAMVVALLAVALVAGYLPARRASRINPMVALRNN